MNTGCLMFDTFRHKFTFVWATKYHKDVHYYDYCDDPPFQIKNYYSDDLNCISVDIHPVLIVNPDRIFTDQSEKIDGFSNTGVCCYLFPNIDSIHNSQHCYGGGGCWRISHYNTEVNMLQRTSQVHRNMFMILKFITEQLFGASVYTGWGKAYKVRSYEVKTGVLHHIKNCTLAEPDIEQCLLDTMKLMSNYFKEENLQNVVSTFNIFNSCTSTTDREQNSLWYQIKGNTFHALSKLCTTGIHSGTADWLKDLRLVYFEIVGALWMSANPRTTHSLNLNKVTHQQVQACVEALDNFVDQRTCKTADSFIKEYALKRFRIERLQRGPTVIFGGNVLRGELEFIYRHRDERLEKACDAFRNSQHHMLTGCFI